MSEKDENLVRLVTTVTGAVNAVQEAQKDLVAGTQKLAVHGLDPEAHNILVPDSPFRKSIESIVVDTMLDAEGGKATLTDKIDKALDEQLPAAIKKELSNTSSDLNASIKNSISDELNKKIENGEIDTSVTVESVKTIITDALDDASSERIASAAAVKAVNDKVETASDNATVAKAVANEAKAVAEGAESKASDAAQAASNALSEAAKAKDAVDSVIDTAENAKSIAESVQGQVTEALDTANAAKSSTDNLTNTVSQLQLSVQTAQTTANSANATADSAKSAADNAKKSADTAQDSADAAKAVADKAVPKTGDRGKLAGSETASAVSGNQTITASSDDCINISTSGAVTLTFTPAAANIRAVKALSLTASAATTLTISGAVWASKGSAPTWGNAGTILVLLAHFVGGRVVLSVADNTQ